MENINIEKEEKKETKKEPNAVRGMIIVGSVGVAVGMGFYLKGVFDGFVLGEKSSYKRGFTDGIVHVNNNLVNAAKVIAEAGKDSKGE